MYTVVKYKQSPFNADSVGQDALILEDEAGRPYAEVGYYSSNLIREGDVLTKEDVIIDWTSKKSKHLVPGDPVKFHDKYTICVGRLISIKVAPKYEMWDDMLTIGEIQDTHIGEENGPVQDRQVEKIRSDVHTIEWLQAELTDEAKENAKWKRIQEEMEQPNFLIPDMIASDIISFIRERLQKMEP